MSRTQRTATDIMFVVGLFTVPVSCGAQIVRTLSTINGVSLAQYVAFTASFLIGLSLALDSRRESPGRIITQQVFLLAAWSIGGITLLTTVLLCGTYHWTSTDTLISILAFAGIVMSFAWAVAKKTNFKDPVIRAWMGISLKAVPQFLLVPKILSEGGAGLTMAFIFVGHVSILMRLVPLLISTRREGMDRNKYWLVASEVLNEISWLVVTAVWLMM